MKIEIPGLQVMLYKVALVPIPQKRFFLGFQGPKVGVPSKNGPKTGYSLRKRVDILETHLGPNKKAELGLGTPLNVFYARF